MRVRSRLLIVLTVVLSVTTMIVFAQGEPMANPDCTADFLSEDAALVDQYYVNAQTALEEGDVRTYLEQLQSVATITSSLRAFCDGYAFEGDAEGRGSQVFGPVTFEEGIYTVTATTDGYIIVEIEGISDECDYFGMALSEGEAEEGAQEVFRVEDEPCEALVQISNLTEDWRVEFSLVSAGD